MATQGELLKLHHFLPVGLTETQDSRHQIFRPAVKDMMAAEQKKTKKKGGAKGMTVPPDFQCQLARYTRVDAALCFLLKNKMNPTLETLSSFLRQMLQDTGSHAEADEADAGKVQDLVTSFIGPAAGDMLSMHWVPCERTFHEPMQDPRQTQQEKQRLRPRANYRLEVLFTRIGGTGAGSSKRRAKNVEAALLQRAKVLHGSFLNALATWHYFLRRMLGGTGAPAQAIRSECIDAVDAEAQSCGGWHPLWRWKGADPGNDDGAAAAVVGAAVAAAAAPSSSSSLSSSSSSSSSSSLALAPTTAWPGFPAVPIPSPPPDYEVGGLALDFVSDNESEAFQPLLSSVGIRSSTPDPTPPNLTSAVKSPVGNIASTDPYRSLPAPFDGDRAVTGAGVKSSLRMPHFKKVQSTANTSSTQCLPDAAESRDASDEEGKTDMECASDIDPRAVLKALMGLPFYRSKAKRRQLAACKKDCDAVAIDTLDVKTNRNEWDDIDDDNDDNEEEEEEEEEEICGDEGQIKHVEILPARTGKYVPFNRLVWSSSDTSKDDCHIRLSAQVEAALRSMGVETLFEHQAEAIAATLGPQRNHVAISTGTSSGKSAVYNVPVVESIIRAALSEPTSSLSYHTDALYDSDEDSSSPVSPVALYLFPTKALAQDQLGALREFLTAESRRTTSKSQKHVSLQSASSQVPPAASSSSSSSSDFSSQRRHQDLTRFVHAAVVDGDTPHAERQTARTSANVIMTNPDMLHITLLPHHRQWHRVLKNLQWVIIDEAHSYKGIFGAHVAGVLRRLVRLCRLHGNERFYQTRREYPLDADSGGGGGLQFIYCSATIANPRQHFAQLVPLHVLGGDKSLTVITDDTAPRGEKLLVFWNPPMRLVNTHSNLSRDDHNEGDGSEEASAHGLRTGKQQLIDSALQLQAIKEEDDVDTVSSSTLGKRKVDVGDLHCKKRSRCGVGTVVAAAAKSVKNAMRRKSNQRGVMPIGEPVERTAGGAVRRIDSRVSGGGAHGGLNDGTSGSAEDDAAESDTTRTSTIVETARLFTSLVKRGVRTLVFSRTRKLTELVLRYSLQDLHATAPELAPLVRGYRGGYTKEDRRLIEQNLFQEKLLGVTATCALELGIDVGSLDATLHMGFPGSLSSLWQQAGRAGRGGRRSLAVLVCFDSPLDQLFCRQPSSLLDRPAETAVVPHDNVIVLRSQLLCAAKEAPLRFSMSRSQQATSMGSATVAHHNASHLENLQNCLGIDLGTHADGKTGGTSNGWLDRASDDGVLFGYGATVEGLHYLLQEGTMTATTTETHQKPIAGCVETIMTTETTCYCHPSVATPTRDKANLRMIDPVTITVVDSTQPEGSGDEGLGGKAIDSIGYSRAFYELFEGAIYLHQARQYLVTHLDVPGVSYAEAGNNSNSPQRPRALVRPVRVNYYTSSRNHTDVDVTKRLECGLGTANVLSTGCVSVVSRVWGWRKHWVGSGRIAEMGQFSLPPLEYSTRAVWIDVPPEVRREIEAVGRQHVPRTAVELECSEPSEVALLSQPVTCSCETTGEDLMEEEANPQGEASCAAQEGGQGRSDNKARVKNSMAMSDRFLAALHGLNHVIVAAAPLFVLCEPDDIATEHVYPFQIRPRPPRVIIFDKRPGGIGVAEALFQHMPAVLAKAHEILTTCPCTAGCPGCVYDSKCTNHNSVVDKAGAALLARRLGELMDKSAGEDSAEYQSNAPAISAPFAEPGDGVSCSSSAGTRMKSTTTLVEASPRRAQRLRMAAAMESARTRGSAVRDAWTNAMIPDFQSMFD